MGRSQRNRSPQHDDGDMLAQVQASVKILSPVPLDGKCGEKDYERLFIREVKAKTHGGKMTYMHPKYHNRTMCITRVIRHDRLLLSAYIDHVFTRHLNQCKEAIESLYAQDYNAIS